MWCMPIPVQSQDGQSIPGSQDTQGWCVLVPVQSQDGQSISGSWDSLAGVDVWCVWSSHYCPGMARVSLELKNSMPFYGVTGHPSLSISLSLSLSLSLSISLSLSKLWPYMLQGNLISKPSEVQGEGEDSKVWHQKLSRLLVLQLDTSLSF